MEQRLAHVAADDALAAIYRLGHDEGAPVIAARLAERLGVSAPAMAGMLQRLARDGLVRTGEARHICLTAEGILRAETMIRRHRLSECLLIDVLGLEWWKAYEEAHLLEHALSDRTEAVLNRRLGYPVRSPFGYPIPGNEADRPLATETLADLVPGSVARVERVFEEDSELLQYFFEQGFLPGVRVRACEHSTSLGMVTVSVGEQPVVLSSQVAGRIWVEQVETPPEVRG
jgi:DtxR family transcriptional regulator, Mn-dependent transcriptional regulator